MLFHPIPVALAAAIGLAACSQAAEQPGAGPSTDSPDEKVQAPELPPPPKRETGREVSVQNDLVDFSYSYPAKAGRIPELKEELDRRLDAARSDLERQANEDRSSAQERNYNYLRHSSATKWSVIADLPEWLSLASEFHLYFGGAHGIGGRESFVWNKNTDRAVNPADFFISSAALQGKAGDEICRILNIQRSERRDVDQPGEGTAWECVDVKKATIFFGSSNGEIFDRIGFYFAPYVAGGFAEGDYEIILPVDTGSMSVVAPQYRSAFATAR